MTHRLSTRGRPERFLDRCGSDTAHTSSLSQSSSLMLIIPLVVTSGDDGAVHTERMVVLLLDGLRYGAAKPR